MKKKIISLLLIMVMIIGVVPTVAFADETVESADSWDGTSDTSWYSDTETEFVLTTANQLAGFSELVDGGNTFAGKTVKLGADIDLFCADENGNTVCFEPIGSYGFDKAFMGTFDGDGKSIKNLYQNTWALDNGYYYSDCGLGLFGLIRDAIIKNLTIDGAEISGESAICGSVAACAYGDCLFENIKIINTNVADYQYYSGGVVGWASGSHRYINCDVAASTTVAAQWGDFDNSTGGIIGGCGGSATIYMKDCDVACRLDVYNDVTSSYQWYAYRRCGMLIGNTSQTTVVDGTTYAFSSQIVAENCSVIYGDWAHYHYCAFAGTSWPYVRAEAGISNSAYSNPRYGHPKDANGNVVVDDNHVHNNGEAHMVECKFDQLYGGGQGVYGGPAPDDDGNRIHEGIAVYYDVPTEPEEMGYDESSHWFIHKDPVTGEETKLFVEDHTSDGWKSDENGHWMECTVCGNKYTEAVHTESDWIIDIEGTFEEDGLCHKECTECGYCIREEVIRSGSKNFLDSWYNTMRTLHNKTFTITAIASVGGEIKGAESVKFNRRASFTITPDEGYEIADVIVNGRSVGAVEKYTFRNVKMNHNIKVIFKETEK